MVLPVLKLSLREASCCKLEVVNGAAGILRRSLFLMARTLYAPSRARASSASHSSRVCTSNFSPFSP